MSSPEKSFNDIALFWRHTEGFFQNHLSVSVPKSPLNYNLADSSTVVS